MTTPRTYPFTVVAHSVRPEAHAQLRALLAGEHGQAVEECMKLLLCMNPERATMDYETLQVIEPR